MRNYQLLIVFLLFAQINIRQANGGLTMSPSEAEVTQAEASAYYHNQKYEEALSQLRKIISGTDSGTKVNVAALELMALIFRQQKEEAQAAGVYKKLIQTAPESVRAPYHYELGTLRYQKKNYTEAKEHFEYSESAGFNRGTSLFFLGLIHFNDQKYRKSLRLLNSSFEEPDSQILKGAIRYYLGNLYLQLGKTESAILNFKEAIANEEPNPISANAAKGAAQALSQLNQSRFFASGSFLTQYDSNVQANPVDVTSALGASYQASLKNIISASAGYATPSTRDFQISPLYSFYGNYNYNRRTRDYNFMSNSLSVFAFHKPYKRFSKGLKVQSSLSFKNTPFANRPGSTLYTKYSLTEEMGPILRYELSPRTFLNSSLFWKSMHYYGDPETGANRRSGNGFAFQTSMQHISEWNYWNPEVYVNSEYDLIDGDNFDALNYGAGLGNLIQIDQRISFKQFFDILASNYIHSTPSRKDQNYSLRAQITTVMNAKWSWVADGSLIFNKSSLPASYKYYRYTSSLGITYSL